MLKAPIPYGRLDSRYMLKGLPNMTRSPVQNITAGGGITVTHGIMAVQGSGGAVTVTADPPISVGIDGQTLYIEGRSNTDILTLMPGTSLHLHGGRISLKDHDYILLIYDTNEARWNEITRNIPESEKAWSFRNASTGTNYVGGFYIFSGANNDFSSTQTIGTGNLSYAAHAFLVLGESTEDDITIRFSGTSITDAGDRTTSDTEDVVFSHPVVSGAYVESIKKWLGQVSIDLISGTGKQCNWGLCKYWDNNNNNFRITGVEVTWLGGASDSDPDIQLLHHKTTSWTYNVGDDPTPPTALATMKGDHGTEHQVAANIEGAWKRDNLATDVVGSDSEGTIFAIVTNSNNAFQIGNILLRISNS